MTPVRSPSSPRSIDRPPAEPTAAYLVRASAFNLGSRLIAGAATLGLAVLTTNVLDTHGRGVYVLLTTWVAIGSTIITGGMAVLAADLIHGRRDVATLHGASTAIATGSLLVLVPLSLVVSLVVSDGMTAALTMTAVLAASLIYMGFEVALAQARGKVLTVSLLEAGLEVLPLAATGVAAVVIQPTATSLIGAWTVAALLTALIQLALATREGALTPWRAAGAGLSVMRRSLGVALWKGATLLCSRIDVLIVAAVLSTSAAGVYSIPVALAASLLILPRSLLTATYHPLMTAPADRLASRLGTALRHGVILVLGAGAVAIGVVAATAGFVFGEAYAGIWQPFAVLVAGSACLAVAEMTGQVLLTRYERQRELVVTWVVALAVNGVLAAAGAAWLGLVGAALSTTITYVLAALAQVWFTARLLSVRMHELVIPRRADLRAYGRVGRSLLATLRVRLGRAR